MARVYLFPVQRSDSKTVADPDDWPFMEQSGKVLANIPDTWKAYPNTEAGMMDIIKMEFGEVTRAGSPKERMAELVHLASACLHLWRHYNAT